MKISDLRMGDVVRRSNGQAYVVANVIGETAHVVRTEVWSVVPDKLEIVMRSCDLETVERLRQRIQELEEKQLTS